MKKSLKRLRESREKARERYYEKGRVAGQCWCLELAEFEQLERLDQLFQMDDGELEQFFENGASDAWGSQERLFFTIEPSRDGCRNDATAFWHSILDGDDPDLAFESEFIRGFATGAFNAWIEMRPQL